MTGGSAAPLSRPASSEPSRVAVGCLATFLEAVEQTTDLVGRMRGIDVEDETVLVVRKGLELEDLGLDVGLEVHHETDRVGWNCPMRMAAM